jgi:hypothetical protein
MIEPYLGYQTGETANDPVGASPEVTDTSSGMGLGLRLGYKFILPWVALDVTQATGKYKDGTPGNTIENDTSTTQLGLVAGVDLPFLFRFWAGYGLQNDITIKANTSANANAVDSKFYGSYVKGGIGFGIIPMLSINVEYVMSTYQKLDLGAGAGKENVDKYYTTLNNNTVMIGVSAPFNF